MLQIRNLCLWSVLTFLSTALCSNAQIRANGFIDPSFTSACPANSSLNSVTRALLVQPDGRIVVGGQFGAPACANGIARLQSTGARDNSFSSPFGVADFVTSIAAQSGGKIIIGGQLTGAGAGFPVARLNANGALDGTFTRLTGIPLIANALAVQGDDKIIAVGAASTSGGIFGFINRFNANGGLDGSFANRNAGGVTPNNQGISAVAIQGARIVIGGSFSIVDTTPRNGLAWLSAANGTLDTLLQSPLTNADVRALLVQSDGKILVAGRFTTDEGANRSVTRLNANGTRDTSFTSLNGLSVTALALALAPDGKILVGHSLGILRLTTNGVLDATFGPLNADGLLGTEADLAAAVALTTDGNVLVGATRVFDDTTTRRGVARLFGNLPPPPVITQQPLTQNVEAGINVSFSIIATGAPPILFQWRKNAVAIKGETNATLVLEDVDSTDAGNFAVVVSNPGGSVTSIVARLSVNFQTAPLTLFTNGLGIILPKLPAELEIGREFTITAKAAAGNVFSNWSGGVTSSSPVLTFVMQSNLVITANFVPSPFIPAVGIYNGLFYNAVSPAHANAGAFTATLDANGGLKGSIRMGTRLRKFTTTFSAERVAITNIVATATDPALALVLELDAVNGVMSGTISFASNVTTLLAFRNPFSSKLNPAPTAGLYNAALPGVEDPAAAPAGDGFVALTVSTAGRVSGKGTLADGTALKILSATSRDAQVPVYAPLYSGRGSVFGWLTITNGELNDVAGTLWWTKPGSVGGQINPNGFSNLMNVIGSFYTRPPAQTPVLLLGNPVAALNFGNLTDPLLGPVSIGTDNKVSGDNQLQLTISPAKGSITGSFVDPSSGKKRAVKGIALPAQNEAHGFFLGTDQSGRLLIREGP